MQSRLAPPLPAHCILAAMIGRIASRCRSLLPAALVFGLWAACAGPAAAGLLDESDRTIYREAFAAAEKRQWDKATELAARARNPLPADYIEWLALTDQQARPRFARVIAFMAAHPDWPWQLTLRHKAETSMPPELDDATVLAFFAGREPATTAGEIRLLEALVATGDADAPQARIRHLWIARDFGRLQEKHFLAVFGASLRPRDHAERLRRLVWDGETLQARRMLTRVASGERRLAEARLALQGRNGYAAALDRVPEKLRRDVGLAFDRADRLARDGNSEAAWQLLSTIRTAPRPDRIAGLRGELARSALRAGHITDAYRIARDHGLEGGPAFADLEWLAGWIALRFLADKDIALAHFSRLYERSELPDGQARGAYWAARAAERLGDNTRTATWLDRAARFPHAYYGQRAASLLGVFPKIPEADREAASREDFESGDLVRLVRMLDEIGVADMAQPVFAHLSLVADDRTEQRHVAALAEEINRPDFMIAAGEQALRHGHDAPETAYPVIYLADGAAAPSPLLLAVARRESRFRAGAVSPAGARGLMQLMPTTAQRVSKDLGIAYTRARLTDDPAYNATLAKAYLARLLKRYDGVLELALAAYNAGPTRVNAWLWEYGDPRSGEIERDDWVELIPFAETRAYVQDILAAYGVYRREMQRGADGPDLPVFDGT
jgi:soluble lytic murein transglycosylase